MIIYKIIKSLFFKSKLYNYYLLKNNIKEILFTPKDIWPGDPILGDKIVQGYYEIAGEKNYSPDSMQCVRLVEPDSVLVHQEEAGDEKAAARNYFLSVTEEYR